MTARGARSRSPRKTARAPDFGTHGHKDGVLGLGAGHGRLPPQRMHGGQGGIPDWEDERPIKLSARRDVHLQPKK